MRECEVDRDAGRVEARLQFSRDLTIFAGHFPGAPLVPGVYLIEASRLLAERFVGTELELARIVDARFTAEVHPEAHVRASATVTRKDEDGEWACDVTFWTEDTQAARIRCRCQRPRDYRSLSS